MPPRRQPTEMEQLIAAQAQLAQVMTQFMANQNNNNGNNNNNNGNNNNNPPQLDALTRFLRLRPAKFSSAPEPMVALDWLRSVNKDLVTVGCTDEEKVRFAAHLLEGQAASWWDTFQITHPIETVTWAMFEEGFRTNHVSSGVLSLKRKEFRNLRQTNRTVSDYIEEFNNLSRYAPEDVDTDAKRRERFLDGLSDELSLQLSVVYCPTFQDLMDKARILEGKHQQVENRKRKFSNFHNSGPITRSRTFRNGNQHNGGNEPNHRAGNGSQHNGGNGYRNNGFRNSWQARNNGHNSGGNGRNHNFVTKKDLSNIECFKCRKLGHYASTCPELKLDVGAKQNTNQKATLNHANVEEVLDDPDLVIGKFPIDSNIALVLFDSGASHSFISRAFVDKNKLPTESLSGSIRVNSPGGELIASEGCRNLTIEIGAHRFLAHLIILESQGIDVILGMDWMSNYDGQIECAQRAITLRTPEGRRIRYRSPYNLREAKLNSLKGVSM